MAQTEEHNRAIGRWLMAGVGMLVVQVILGGITRLTGSGLSITEWNPIMGAVPPLNEEQWQQAFAGYRKIAQYKYLNNDYTLQDFKFIFFWEWFHRLWARLIGLAFLIPFLYFLIKGYFKKSMILPLVLLFVLGGLQGLIGWLMVTTGLNNENLHVTHVSLAIHFLAAMLLIGFTWIFALSLLILPGQRFVNSSLKNFSIIIIGLIVVQFVYGAFMAGLKAAGSAPTWPGINGSFVPPTIFSGNFLRDALHHPITIQFIHRMLAYLIFLLIFAWWWKTGKENQSNLFKRVKTWPLFLVTMQVVIGIYTVLESTSVVDGKFGLFGWLAVLHQLTGMLLLLSILALNYLLKPAGR